MLNEPVFLSFEIRNYSPQALCLGVGGDYRNSLGRPDSFTVTVNRADGTAVPQPKAVGFGGISGCAYIPVAESHIIKLFLPHWALFEETGSYTINVKRRMAFFNYEPKPTFLPRPGYCFSGLISARYNLKSFPTTRIKWQRLLIPLEA